MLTLTLILIPLLSAVLLFASGKQARYLALGMALLEFFTALFALSVQQSADASLLSLNLPWISSMGASFHIGMDGISMLMVLLSTALLPLIIYASFNREYKNSHVLYALMMLMQSAMIGSFTALDGLLFYLFWEIALIPIFFIVLVWGGEKRAKITFKFFIYTLFGSLFMLLALIYVYLQNPERSFDIAALYTAGRSLPLVEQGLVMGAFFLAFAIKMPVFPFHTWQPDTYYSSPVPGVMMLGGIMSKMAVYGMIRWVLPMVPDGVQEYGSYAIALSVISIIYASLVSIVQKDFKYLIAFSSIAHMGLISAGILSVNDQGIQGAMMESLTHGINTVGMFFVFDIIVSRTGTSHMKDLGGIRSVDSRFAFMYFIVVLSMVALPFTNGFVGEFLLILGIFQAYPVAGALAGLSIILGVVYMFRSFQTMMLGETNALTAAMPKLQKQEYITLIVIVLLIIGMGVYPKPLLHITEPSIQLLLKDIQ